MTEEEREEARRGEEALSGPLAAFVGAGRGLADRELAQIESARSGSQADEFEIVLARVRARADEEVSGVSLELGALAAAARAVGDEEVARRRVEALEARRSGKRRSAIVPWAWLAAAGVLLGALGLVGTELARRADGASATAIEAPYRRTVDESRGEAGMLAPRGAAEDAGPSKWEASSDEPSLAPIDAASGDPEKADDAAGADEDGPAREDGAGVTGSEDARPGASAAPVVEAARGTKRESKADRLVRLDARARESWREGRYTHAIEDFERIVALGGRHQLAELAFGDLLTLARQGHGDETTLQRRYLDRFPRGRYADDARAGLCEDAKGRSQVDCWRDYLGDFPKGSHRTRAERALSREGAEAALNSKTGQASSDEGEP